MARVKKTVQIEVSYDDRWDVDIEEYVAHLLSIGKFRTNDMVRKHYGNPSVGEPSLVEND